MNIVLLIGSKHWVKFKRNFSQEANNKKCQIKSQLLLKSFLKMLGKSYQLEETADEIST